MLIRWLAASIGLMIASFPALGEVRKFKDGINWKDFHYSCDLPNSVFWIDVPLGQDGTLRFIHKNKPAAIGIHRGRVWNDGGMHSRVLAFSRSSGKEIIFSKCTFSENTNGFRSHDDCDLKVTDEANEFQGVCRDQDSPDFEAMCVTSRRSVYIRKGKKGWVYTSYNFKNKNLREKSSLTIDGGGGPGNGADAVYSFSNDGYRYELQQNMSQKNHSVSLHIFHGKKLLQSEDCLLYHFKN